MTRVRRRERIVRAGYQRRITEVAIASWSPVVEHVERPPRAIKITVLREGDGGVVRCRLESNRSVHASVSRCAPHPRIRDIPLAGGTLYEREARRSGSSAASGSLLSKPTAPP